MRCCGGRCSRPSTRTGGIWTASCSRPRTGSPSVSLGSSSTNPTWTCGSRPYTWPGQQALGTQCRFTEKGFLKALGRQSGKSGRDWLQVCLCPAGASLVEISDGRWTYGGSLLEFYRDEDTGRTVLEINPKLAPFFGPTRWTQIDWEQRQRLRGKPLALWLHGFYASHAAPYPLTVEYLHKLSGSQTKQLKHFKQNLTQALRDLEAVGAIRAFEIRDELVHVWTVPSKSQRKHLAVRRPPARRRK